jgi:hypothetical protein
MKLIPIVVVSTAVLVAGAAITLRAQTIVPTWVGNLVLGEADLSLQSSAASTQEELPGLGHKFELLSAMQDDQDPQNITNDVISVLTTTDYPAGSGTAFRNTPPGFHITALDHQINLKYYFPSRSCSGGSPRVQVGIDRNGDGAFDGNAFGYVGHASFGTGCITGEWDIIDMTDNIGRWDLSQFGGGMTMNMGSSRSLHCDDVSQPSGHLWFPRRRFMWVCTTVLRSGLLRPVHVRKPHAGTRPRYSQGRSVGRQYRPSPSTPRRAKRVWAGFSFRSR